MVIVEESENNPGDMNQPRKLTEEQLHKQCVKWLKLQYPKVMFITDLSGVSMHPVTAAKVSALRSSNGFPDIIIFEPKVIENEFHEYEHKNGLMIELKRETPYKRDGHLKKDKHLQEQNSVHKKLRDRGYAVHFCWSFDSFREIVNQYFEN